MGKLAALNKVIEGAQKALDMARDARLQRARDMGFDTDTVWYHGTDSEIDAFRTGQKSKRYTTFSEREIDSQGIFFTDNAEDAAEYGPRTGQYYVRSAKMLYPPSDIPVSSRDETGLARVRELYDDIEYALQPAIDEIGYIDVDGGMSSVMTDDAGRWLDEVMTSEGMDWYHLDNPEVIARLRERGYDSVVTHEPDGINTPRSLMVLDPANIRSINARFDPEEASNPNLLASLTAGAVGLGAMGASEDSEAGVITKGGRKLLEAWHGSPHKFDKFSMDKIGTGEGAQAYGHGLYFTDTEDVARGYRDKLSQIAPDVMGGSVVPDHAIPAIRARMTAADEAGDSLTAGALDELLTGDFTPDKIRNDILEAAELEGLSPDGALAALDEAVSLANSSPGALYRVELDVDPDTLLDWDKPLSDETIEYLKDRGIEDIMPKRWSIEDFRQGQGRDQELTGRTLWETLNMGGMQVDGVVRADPRSAAPATAAWLRDAGIPGIRYLDGNSRGAGEGSYNYVMFDDDRINILERGNIDPTLLAGMGAASAAFAGATQGKSDYWKAIKEDITSAFDAGLNALEMPMRGYHGITATMGALAAGQSLDDALLRGGDVARQPISDTAQELADAVFEETGSPELATAVYTGTNIADVF